MKRYEEIVSNMLQAGELSLCIEQGELSALIDSKCYTAIEKICNILSDDTLSDPECFLRIEAIVHTLESIGISCAARHDFG